MKLLLLLVLVAFCAAHAATVEGVHGRQKREVCKWLGTYACTAWCKVFGRGSHQGECIGGTCRCLVSNQQPSYGGNGFGYGNGYGNGYGRR